MMINAQKLQHSITTSGFTQESFAKMAGISRTTLHNILKTGELKKERLLPIFAELLKLPPAEIVDANRVIARPYAPRESTRSELSQEERVAYETTITMLRQQIEKEKEEKKSLLDRLLGSKRDD